MSSVDQRARNEAVVRELYDCLHYDRLAGLESIVAPSHVDHSNGRNGPAGFATAAANLHQAYSDLRVDLKTIVASGDLVVVQWHETGVHTGQFFNLKPTNKPFEATGLNMYRVIDGKITESWISVDPSTIRAQQEGQAALQDA